VEAPAERAGRDGARTVRAAGGFRAVRGAPRRPASSHLARWSSEALMSSPWWYVC